MNEDPSRIEVLEAELEAARKVIDALIERAERQSQDIEHFAVQKAMAALENVIAERTRALRSSEARFRTLYDHSPDMLFTVDSDGHITAANQTSATAFGCRIDEMVGRNLASLFEPPSSVRPVLAAEEHGDHELTLSDGRQVSVTAASVPGYPGVMQVGVRDISMRTQLAKQLQHSRRLAAIGHLAAGVAHEINNPLAVMQLRLEYAEEHALHKPDVLRESLRIVRKHALRIGRIVENLQSFARPPVQQHEDVLVHQIVASAREVASRWLSGVRVGIQIPAGLTIRADPGQIEQVLVNLLTNAAQATDGRGRVTITAQTDPHQDRFVQIAVEDDGPGIPEELLGSLFAPFVSGRASGSGIGLAITWGILQEHGGHIEATNRLEGGARFTLSLPAGTNERAVDVTPEEAPAQARSLRILCVEDEPALVELIVDFAALDGHRVDAVATAEEALTQLERETYDAVLTDVRLPGISGDALARSVVEAHPHLDGWVALMSGGFPEEPGEWPFLQKPFGHRELLQLLAALGPRP